MNCTLDGIIESKCGVFDNYFIYDEKYGDRSRVISENYISTNNTDTIEILSGWYGGDTQIKWTSDTLVPSNIKKDKKIFGVVGTLDNTVYSDCVLNQSSADLTSPNSAANCYVPSGSNYVYSSYWGGRENTCSFVQVDSISYKLVNNQNGSRPKGSCWIDTSGNDFNINNGALKISGSPSFVIRNTATNITCPISGSGIGFQSISCTSPDRNSFSGFFYPSTVRTNVLSSDLSTIISGDVSGAFGGRSRNCVYGANIRSCWIADADAYVENDTSCSEKIPNGSVDSMGSPIAVLGDPFNSFSCKTPASLLSKRTNNNQVTSTVGRFVYTLPQGGRNLNCQQITRSGTCFFNTDKKSDLDPDLIPENIQNGLTIFGVTGSYVLDEITYGSGAHRNPSGTSSPNRIDYKKNITGESNFLESSPAVPASTLYPVDYNPIPKIANSSDSDVQKVDRSTWGTTQCGLTGTVTSRITNCATVLTTAKSKWKGQVVGNAGQVEWDLVTRKQDSVNTSLYHEVWRDSRTQLLWSSLVSSNLNWCKASGSNGKKHTDGTYDLSTYAEDDPFNYCETTSLQSQNLPVSACALDPDSGSGVFSFSTDFNQVNTPGKAGLLPTNAISSGRVIWRLPTIYDYMLANHHGLRFVLPDIGIDTDEEWTATVSARNKKNAWTYSGKFGVRQFKQRNNPAAVRCVGR